MVSEHPVVHISSDFVSLHSTSLDGDDQFRFVRSMLPLVTQWPRDLTRRFLCDVYAKYFRGPARASRFKCAVLVHRAETPRDGVSALSQAGVFSTRAGRDALLEIVEEARGADSDGLCKVEVLDAVERYARYAFVLDGTDMTCGSLPDV